MSRRPFRTSSTFWRSDPSPAPSGSNPARSTERNQATLGDQTDPIQISDSDDEPERTQNKTSFAVPGPSNRMHTYRQSNVVIGSQHSNLALVHNQQRIRQVTNDAQLHDDVRLDGHGVKGGNAIAASPSIDIDANNGQNGEIMDEADLNAPSDDDDENEEEDQVAPSSPRDGKEDQVFECESDDKDEEAVFESSDDDKAESELASQRNPPIRSSSIKTNKNNLDQRASSSSQPEIYSKARIDELLKAHCPPRNPITFASDDYCWLCHDNFKQYPGFEVVKVVMCYRCKLCWHKKCSDKVFEDKADTLIKKTSQPKYKDNLERKQAWIRDLPSVKDPKICIECARKEAGFVFCVFEGFLKDVDLNNDDVMFRIYTCFQYIIDRLKNQRNDRGKQIFEEYQEYEYINLVQEQINFRYIRDNWFLYRCTEDFLFDIKRLYHNMIVIARDQCIDLYLPKEIAKLDLMLAIVTQELEAIDRCDSCYRNYYELDISMVQNEIWMPCENAHSLVWAPNHDLWWPAKVYEYREKNYFYLSDEFVWIEYFGKINNPKRIRVLKKNSSHVNLYTYARVFPKKSIPISKDNKLKWDKRQKQAITETEHYHTKYWNQYYNEKYALKDTSQEFSLDDLFQVVENINDIKNDPNFVLVNSENESENLNENKPSTSGKRKASDQQSSSKKNMNAAPSKDSVPKKHSVMVCTCGKKKAPICTVHKHP